MLEMWGEVPLLLASSRLVFLSILRRGEMTTTTVVLSIVVLLVIYALAVWFMWGGPEDPL